MANQEITIKQFIASIRDLNTSLRTYQKCSPFCQGLTFTQFNILDLIMVKTYIEISDLTRELSIDKSTTTRLAEPLIKDGLIMKDKSRENARNYELIMTEKGKKVHWEVFNCLENYFSRIDKNQLGEIVKALQTFNNMLSPFCE
jgi:DNA-binding MarR family transcriptional regulator